MPTEVDGSETIHNLGNFGVFYPPGGTPRLYGTQDARRHGTTALYAKVNMNGYSWPNDWRYGWMNRGGEVEREWFERKAKPPGLRT